MSKHLLRHPVGASMSSTDACIGSNSSSIGAAIRSGVGSQATARGSEAAVGGAQVETARDSDGSATYYIGIAAKYYFDKPVSELGILETAFIAGMVKGPSRYDPFFGSDENN